MSITPPIRDNHGAQPCIPPPTLRELLRRVVRPAPAVSAVTPRPPLSIVLVEQWRHLRFGVWRGFHALRALLPWNAARTISALKQERDEARLMLTLLAAEVVQSKRRPSKEVERLLEKFLPTAREW